MRLDAFRQGALLGRGKNLFLWQAEKDELRCVLGADGIHEISIVDLLEYAAAFSSWEAVSDHLHASLKARLESVFDDPAIVVVHDCAILCRYLSDLVLFFKWLAEGQRMVILVYPPLDTARLAPVPNGLVIAPGTIGDRLRKLVSEEQIVEVN